MKSSQHGGAYSPQYISESLSHSFLKSMKSFDILRGAVFARVAQQLQYKGQKRGVFMQNLSTKFVSIIFLCMLSACGGVTGTGNPCGEVICVELQEAKDELATGSISEARDAYTQIIEKNTSSKYFSKSVDSFLSVNEAHLGRAICDLLLFAETAPVTDILTNLGQGAWDVEASIFDPEVGLLARSFVDGVPQTQDFSDLNLPFQNITECWGEAGYKCIISQVAAGYSFEAMAASLQLLSDGTLSSIVADLNAALNVEDLHFSIPRDLYNGDDEINLHRADAMQLLAGVHILQAMIDFANSYRFNVDLSALIDEDGNELLTSAGLVALLNQQFALRDDHRLESAQAHLREALLRTAESMNEVLGGIERGTLIVTEENRPVFTDIADGVESALESFTSPTKIAGILPDITLNLVGFFESPFEAAAIIQLDPFVLDEGGQIKAVEFFWQEAINTALVGCQVGDCGSAFFSASSNVSQPFVAVFTELEELRIGRWRLFR